MDPWTEIVQLTGVTVHPSVIAACMEPKLVTVPAGRILYAAGPMGKTSMLWGAFEELDADWYRRGNQLDPSWYGQGNEPVAIYEYRVTLARPIPAIMSKVADQPGVLPRIGPPKFQYFNPAGFGRPIRGRLLGHWAP
jgi:hypothetical protein